VGDHHWLQRLDAGVRTDEYRVADPLFRSPPPIPLGRRPWASAIPSWNIGDDFTLQPASPALAAGVDPTVVKGLTSALAAGIRTYMKAADQG
jgi:hypothetical protein